MTKSKIGWRTLAYANEIKIVNAKLIVSESGRKRFLKTGKKNVHAFIEGELADWNGYLRSPDKFNFGKILHFQKTFLIPDDAIEIRYNPIWMKGFMEYETETFVERASLVYVSSVGVFIKDVV